MNKLIAALALTGAALLGAGTAHADPAPGLGDNCTVLGAATTDDQGQQVQCVAAAAPEGFPRPHIWVLLGAVE